LTIYFYANFATKLLIICKLNLLLQKNLKIMSAENNQPVYFTKLEIDNVLCFKKPKPISFLDKNGAPALFTVILGNNNTGKTTILKMLGGWVTQKDPSNGKEVPVPNIYLFPTKPMFPENPNYTLTFTQDIVFKVYNRIATMAIPDENVIIEGYGINRKIGLQNTTDYNIDKIENRIRTIFENEGTPYLLNSANWFISLLAEIGEAFAGRKTAKLLQERLDLAKNIVNEIFATAEQTTNKDIISIDAGKVSFTTALGDKVRLSELGSGYQSLLTWVLDLAYRMFMRYPKSKNPIAEPAIVLVDELDLHLHPEWQRRVVIFLRKLFPKTQFIVTAHSPLVVQSAADLNVIVLQKNPKTQSVDIIDANDKFGTETFEGWSVQEILRDLMMEKSENLYSERYTKWKDKFTNALRDSDLSAAKEAFDELSKFVNEESGLLERWRIQMSALAHLQK